MSDDIPTLREWHESRKIVSSRYWREDEIAVLRQMVESGESCAAAGRALGRSENSAQNMAKRIGLVSKAVERWTPEEDEYLREWFYRQPRKVTAAKLGRSAQTIDNRRRKLGMAPKGKKHA